MLFWLYNFAERLHSFTATLHGMKVNIWNGIIGAFKWAFLGQNLAINTHSVWAVLHTSPHGWKTDNGPFFVCTILLCVEPCDRTLNRLLMDRILPIFRSLWRDYTLPNRSALSTDGMCSVYRGHYLVISWSRCICTAWRWAAWDTRVTSPGWWTTGLRESVLCPPATTVTSLYWAVCPLNLFLIRLLNVS